MAGLSCAKCPSKATWALFTNGFVLSTGAHDRNRAEAILRQLIDIPLQHVCVVKPNGDVLYANDWLLKRGSFIQTTRIESTKHVRTRFHAECREKSRLESSERTSGIARSMIRFNPLRGKQGNIICSYAAGTDIDDQKQAELR
jgi:PAS domain-containing protein